MDQQQLWDVEVRLRDRSSIPLLWHRASAALVRQGALVPVIQALAACSEFTDAIAACANDCQADQPTSSVTVPSNKSNGRASRSGTSSDSTNKTALLTLTLTLASLDEAWPRSLHREAVDSYAAYLRGVVATAVQGARHLDPAFAHAGAELIQRAYELRQAVRESLVAQRLQNVISSLTSDLDSFAEDQQLKRSHTRRLSSSGRSNDESDNENKMPGDGTATPSDSLVGSISKLQQELDACEESPMLSRYRTLEAEQAQLTEVVGYLVMPCVKLAQEFKSGRATINNMEPQEEAFFAVAVDFIVDKYTKGDERSALGLGQGILEAISTPRGAHGRSGHHGHRSAFSSSTGGQLSAEVLGEALNWLMSTSRTVGRVSGASAEALLFRITQGGPNGDQTDPFCAPLLTEILDGGQASSTGGTTHSSATSLNYAIDTELLVAVCQDWQVRNAELTELGDDAMCRENIQQADRLGQDLGELRIQLEERNLEVGRTLANEATRAKRFEQLRWEVSDIFKRQVNLRVRVL